MLPDDQGNTTAIVHEYVAQLAELPQGAPQNARLRELLGRAVGRLHLLCASVLYQRYPRLTQAPLNLQAEELLSAVVERLIKAMQKAQPSGVRQFFALRELSTLFGVSHPESTSNVMRPVSNRLEQSPKWQWRGICVLSKRSPN